MIDDTTMVEALRWAVQEVREMDELCRGQVPGYGSLTSADMDKIHLLERIIKERAA